MVRAGRLQTCHGGVLQDLFPGAPRPTSSGLRPGTLDLPLPSLRYTEPNESRTSLQTGPDTGANWTEPGALPVLAAGRAPGWSPRHAGHPEPCHAFSRAGAESRSLCTLLCRPSAMRSRLCYGGEVIKWDNFLFYSFAGCGLSLCCRGRRVA